MRTVLSVTEKEPSFTISFDGTAVPARAGQTIGAALAASGRLALRQTRSGAPRGLHCGMGACFDCVVTVDGEPGVRACLRKAEPGADIRSVTPDAGALGALEAAQFTTARQSVDVLVVGGGPAGAVVAARLAEAGASVLVCDERDAPGGQYFKPLMVADEAQLTAGSAARTPDRQFREGAELTARLARSGAEVLTGATLWFASRRDGFGIVRKGETRVVMPRFAVLATGASERPCPVPGWTLPGVMTTGGLQALARSQRIVPGRKVIVAGSGPLNLQLALEMARLGHPPIAVVDEGPGPGPGAMASLLAMLRADPKATLTGLGYLAGLKRAGVPVLWNSRITSITGETQVERVSIDVAGSARDYACDLVALNAGFAPQADIARQLGCDTDYVDADVGAVAVVTDVSGRSSIPDIFAIGDGARIGGAQVAMARAELAASAIGRDLGLDGFDAVSDGPARHRLARAEAFQKALWNVFRQRPFDPAALHDDTILCRCEEVSAGAVRKACRDVAPTLASVKRQTRAGMGRCQGRFCVGPLTRLVHAAGGPPPDAAAFFAPRPPARPVPLGAVAVEKPEWGGHRRAVPPAASPRVAMRRASLDMPSVDVAVIGAGVVGACVAMELARGGQAVIVLDRHEPNVQASGANAGSLHVQLLSFDFGQKARAGGQPAAEVLRIAPASIALWREIGVASGQDLEMSTPGGLMVAETEADIAFLRQKVALERSFGIDADLIDGEDVRRLEPYLSQSIIGAALCRDEGKINPLVATSAVVALAKAAGARFESFAGVTGLSRAGGRWRVETEAGPVMAARIVNCAGGWASRIAAMAARPIPVAGAPLQMIVTEAGPPLVKHLLAHASRHLSLKQADTGGLIIGGAWPAGMDELTGASQVEIASIEGNAWVAAHVLPAAAALRIVRVWAAMNIDIDGAPILGEMPGAPGFFNCVTSNGYSLAPVVARITADLMLRGRSDHPSAIFSLDRFTDA